MECDECGQDKNFLMECWNCDRGLCLDCIDKKLPCPDAPGGHDLYQDSDEQNSPN